jgi:hypothetical protein
MHCFVASDLDVFFSCIFLHCIAVLPSSLLALSAFLSPLVNLVIVRCVVFGVFVFAKAVVQSRQKCFQPK